MAGLNAFHICGIVLATWAVVLTVIGMARPDFPKTQGAARGVMGLSIVLVALAIGTGIFTSAVEDAEHEEEAGAAVHEEAGATEAADEEAAAPEEPAQTP
jgi:hypothetical protein